MDPLIQLLTLLFGFLLGFILYEFLRYRVGGVVAIPIIVVYTLENPLMLPIFLYAIVICMLLVHIIAEKTLLYGRRLLYLYLGVSITTTSTLFFLLSSILGLNLTALTVGTIFPGIVGYNLSREAYDFESLMKSAAMMVWNLLIVLLFAISLSFISGAGL